MEASVEWWVNFRKRVDNWDKSRSRVYSDKREAALEFAVEVLDGDPATATKFIYRENIKWDIIHSYESHGKPVRCKVCGNDGVGGYWCGPCIHHDWCCDCCILLGTPFYGGGIYMLRKVKCPHCQAEFSDFECLGREVNLGLGVRVSGTQSDTSFTCPKCGQKIHA